MTWEERLNPMAKNKESGEEIFIEFTSYFLQRYILNYKDNNRHIKLMATPRMCKYTTIFIYRVAVVENLFSLQIAETYISNNLARSLKTENTVGGKNIDCEKHDCEVNENLSFLHCFRTNGFQTRSVEEETKQWMAKVQTNITDNYQRWGKEFGRNCISNG